MASVPVMDPAWAAESNLTRILAITGAIHLLALISVGLRLYARIGILKTPGRDDVVIVLSVLGALGGWICFALQGNHGLGRHTKIQSKADGQAFDHIAFWQSIVSAIAALGLLKISIALFLLRLSNNKWYSRSLWALIGFVSFYSFGAWLTFFLRCRPMKGFWDRRYSDSCYSMQLLMAFGLVNTAFNIFTDVCFATLPIPIIWKLQMSSRTKISLLVILSLGYLAVAMGIIKTVFQITLVKDADRTFNQSVQFWGFMQLNVGIIAASIPALKPLLKKATGTSTGPNYNQYADIEKPKTVGSRGPSRPCRSIIGTLNDTRMDDFEMESTARLSPLGQDRRASFALSMRSEQESKNLIPDEKNQNCIRCTTEVVIDSVGVAR